MTSQAHRFLDIYAELERSFRKRLAAENIRSFSAMVKELSKSDRAVGRFRDDLLQWHDLRNAIVHERPGKGLVIAEPLQDAVDDFDRIARVLLDPPLLTSRFQREVSRVSPAAMVSEATSIMREKKFSQLPVYDGDTLTGVLTSQAVAHWLGNQWSGGAAGDAPVGEVLDHAADDTLWVTLSRHAHFLDGLEAFDQALNRGQTLTAILLTHDGKRTQKPIGIVTAADIPELLSAVML